MNKLMALTLVACALVLSQSAGAAYFVAVKNSGGINPSVPAHVLVTGRGMELGTLFQRSAQARSERLVQLYPNHQIVWVIHDELMNDSQPALITRFGFKILKYSPETLSPALVLQELRNVRKIASLNIYAHTSALYGAQMGGGDNRIPVRDERYAALRDRFVPGAYAIFQGCNSGFYMAPWYSKKWGIPVMGAFTATDFEQRHENGNFYRNEKAFKPDGAWETKGTQNIRMKPDMAPYKGIWGDYKEGGLTFQKTFCPAGKMDEKCAHGMAEALLAFTARDLVTSPNDRAALISATKEFMCPTGRQNLARHLACAQQVDNIAAGKDVNENFNPFIGKALECDFNDCKFKMDNCKPAMEGSLELKCDLRNLSETSTTWAREVRAYLAGIEVMSRKGTRLK